MIKMINATTGTEMYVHELRLDEYLARGHRLAVPPPRVRPAPAEPEPPKPKRTAPKTARKK